MEGIFLVIFDIKCFTLCVGVFQKTIAISHFKMQNLIYSRVSMFRKITNYFAFYFLVLAMQVVEVEPLAMVIKMWREVFSRLVMFLKRLRMVVLEGDVSSTISGKICFCCGGE